MTEFLHKAVIFDLDGVLVDTAEFHYRAWKALARELEIPFNREINEKLKGVSRSQSLEIILQNASKNFTADEKKEFLARKNRQYLEYVSGLDASGLLPGVAGFLRELKKKSFRLAVGSSSKNARKVLERLQITNMFDAIVDGTQITRSKPDPEIFLKAARALDLPPHHCVVIEDAPAGVTAAKRAGMRAVGIGRASSFPDADAVVPSTGALCINLIKALLL